MFPDVSLKPEAVIYLDAIEIEDIDSDLKLYEISYLELAA